MGKTFYSHFLRYQSDVFNQLNVKKVHEKQEVTTVTGIKPTDAVTASQLIYCSLVW